MLMIMIGTSYTCSRSSRRGSGGGRAGIQCGHSRTSGGISRLCGTFTITVTYWGHR